MNFESSSGFLSNWSIFSVDWANNWQSVLVLIGVLIAIIVFGAKIGRS